MFVPSNKAWRPIFTVAALGLVVPILAALGSPASAATRPAVTRIVSNVDSIADKRRLHFFTLNNKGDPTFNELLGINDTDVLAGYFGFSAASGHPNRGYTVSRPYRQADYRPENFPGAPQTQAVAINNRDDTAGVWTDAKGSEFGFIKWNGEFRSYRDPHTGSGTVNRILGLNDAGMAVGFYTDGKGLNHGYALNRATGKFMSIELGPGDDLTAAGINDNNDVTGYFLAENDYGLGLDGFLLKDDHAFQFTFPNATVTLPTGINVHDEIVGTYIDQAGNAHGFILRDPLTRPKFHSVDDPNAVIGTTIVIGVNDDGDLVGYYRDRAGNIDGFLARY